jgi:hypothetical protein
VVWNEIKKKLQIMIPEPVPELEERFVSPELLVDCVSADGKRRSRHVFYCKIGQCGPVFLEKGGMLCGNISAGLSVIPHPQEPDPVETQSGDTLQKCIRHIGEGGFAPKPSRDFTEPDACIDLKDRGTRHDL